MRMVVIGLLLAAVLIAGLVVVLLTQFVPEQSEVAQTEKEEYVQVLVATDTLKIGDSLVSGKYEWRNFPKSGELSGYIVREEGQNIESQYTNAVVIKDVATGEPITSAHVFKKDTPGFVSVQLPPGKRAVTVKVSDVTSSGGFILPGDYVDVMLTHSNYSKYLKDFFSVNFPEANGAILPSVLQRFGVPSVQSIVTETVLTNLRVLALDTKLQKGEGTAIKAKNATLEVSPKEMQILTTAAQMGTLSLALRSLRPAVEVDDEDLLFATTDIESSGLMKKFHRAAFGSSSVEEDAEGAIDVDVLTRTVLFGTDEMPTDDTIPDIDKLLPSDGMQPPDGPLASGEDAPAAGGISIPDVAATIATQDGGQIGLSTATGTEVSSPTTDKTPVVTQADVGMAGPETPLEPQVIGANTAPIQTEGSVEVVGVPIAGEALTPDVLEMPQQPAVDTTQQADGVVDQQAAGGPLMVGPAGMDMGPGDQGGNVQPEMPVDKRKIRIYKGGIDTPEVKELP